MKLKRLILENFMALEHARIDLDDKGLVLIQGVNKDDPSAASNGAGKSAIVDGIAWCLFGETARGISGDEVVNNTAGKNCRAVLTVEDEGRIFTISRHRKHKEGKNRLLLFRDGEELTKGTDKLTQADVEKVIGCGADVFKSAIYAGQEQMPDLPGMTDKNLKKIVEQAAGIDKLQDAYDLARSDLSALKVDLTKAQTELSAIEANSETIRSQIKSSLADHKAWESGKSGRISAAESDVANAQLELDEAEKKLDEADKSAAESALDEVRAKIDSVTGEVKELESLKAEEAKMKREVENFTIRIRIEKDSYEKAKSKLSSLSDRIGEPCGECGRNHDESTIGTAIESAKADLDKTLENLKSLKASYENAGKALKIASDAVSSFIGSMTDLSAERSRERELSAYLTSIGGLERDVDNKRGRVDMLTKRLEEIKAEESPHLPVLKRLKTQLEASIEKSKAKADEVSEIEGKFKIAESVVKVFSPAGVRAHVLDSVTPFLNAQTSHYLGTLTDGNISAEWSTLDVTKGGETREKFNIAVKNVKGASSFGGLSGGEKRKVRIATALALQDLVAARATKPIDLFVGDEIDDALDQAGLERLMGILEMKAREKGTVLLISHNPLKDWIRQSITVTKESGKSRVEGLEEGALS